MRLRNRESGRACKGKVRERKEAARLLGVLIHTRGEAAACHGDEEAVHASARRQRLKKTREKKRQIRYPPVKQNNYREVPGKIGRAHV